MVVQNICYCYWKCLLKFRATYAPNNRSTDTFQFSAEIWTQIADDFLTKIDSGYFLPLAEATPKHTMLLSFIDLKEMLFTFELTQRNEDELSQAFSVHYVTFKFLNFKMTSCCNFSGAGSKATVTILVFTYL